MGCGAVPKDSVSNSVHTLPSKPIVNNSNRKINGYANNSIKTSNTSINNNNNNNNNKTPLKTPVNNKNNNNGFKQADIKYSNEYLQNKNNPVAQSTPVKTNNNNNKQTNTAPLPPKSNGVVSNNKTTNNNNNNNKTKPDNNKNNKTSNQQPIKPPVQYKEAVAFTITFDDNNKTNVEEIDKSKPPPPGFKLAPLKSRPQITQAQIDEKMRAVELKREQILAEKIKQSKQTSIKTDVIKQRYNYENEYNLNRIENNLDSASKQRDAKLEEIKEKQRRQDEKRQKIIKDRRNIANQEIDDLRYNEFERDRYYNREYDDF